MNENISDYEVKALCCPQCGAPIEGSGACPSCNQLLLVTRQYGVLDVSFEDIKDVEIKPPDEDARKASADPCWEIYNWGWPENQLLILGVGDPEVGARLVAMWCSDHREEIFPGTRRPGWRDIQEYTIAKALKANRK